jgi:hypothetical protein
MPPGNPGMPPGYGYNMPPQAPRSNGAAIGSLICGILGCVPFLTGLVAIILGIVGLRKTRDPAVGGKGMSIAGLILGIVSILAWAGFGGVFAVGYLSSQPARVVARQFLTDLSSGQTDAALAESTMSAAQIDTEAQNIKQFGSFKDATFFGFNASSNASYGPGGGTSSTTMKLAGSATFANGARPCEVDLVKVNGTYKVSFIRIQ